MRSVSASNWPCGLGSQGKIGAGALAFGEKCLGAPDALSQTKNGLGVKLSAMTISALETGGPGSTFGLCGHSPGGFRFCFAMEKKQLGDLRGF